MKKMIFLLILSALLPASAFCRNIKVITIKNYIINPVTEEYIRDNLKKAEQQNSSALIIRLNTPGGLLKSTQNIVKDILNARIPVITYIWPKGTRAASAGTFIGYASSILVMAPSTHIGAAHPVLGGGAWGKISQEMQNKIMNDTLAWAKNIAEEKHRPYDFLEEAINESKSLTEKEALRRKIIDLIAHDLDDLLRKIEAKTVQLPDREIVFSSKNARMEFIELTPRQKFLNTILDPNIAYLLFTLGFLGLIFEVTHPGFGFPGIAGIICIILALYAFSVLPVNYAGIALIILGITFFLVEAFTPTFGLFTLGGAMCFILGSIMLFDRYDITKISWQFIMPTTITLSIISLFFLSKIAQTYRRRSVTGEKGLTGEVGVARTDILKKGKVFIHGELWNARSQEAIKKGEEVVVEKVKGLILTVKKKEEEQ